MKKATLISVSFLMICCISCLKEPNAPTGGNKIIIGATTADTVSYNNAKVSTTLTNTGGNTITQHGHCWSAEPDPEVSDDHTSLGSISAAGKFTSSLTGLPENTKYYIRAYFTTDGGTIYGNSLTFITKKRGRPVVATGFPSELTTTSVKLSGTAVSDSGSSVTQKGMVWDTIGYPTVITHLGISQEGANLGSFTNTVSDLKENHTYYYSAYATNGIGTSYGEIKSFQTVLGTPPTVTTSNYSDVTTNSALCGGEVTYAGNGTVTARGVCWNTAGNPTLSNALGHSTDGAGTGQFTSSITGLTDGTTYYVAAYATNEKGPAYGTVLSFQTTMITKPVVTTASYTNLKYNSVICGGNVTNAGNGTVTAKGVCWNTTGNPTLTNALGSTLNGTGTGQYVSNVSGLNELTNYFITAYATNEKGTSYGDIKQFTTPQLLLPLVTTAAVTNITATTATCGGNVTSDGNGTVTVRGVCWNITGNPTLSNSLGHTTDGAGTGAFTSNMTGLAAGFTYHVTAYATNEKGPAYSTEIKQFITPIPCGQLVVSYGGKNYSTVKIGTQCWFKENLNIGTRINGSVDQSNNGTIEKYCYGDNEANCNTYGGLYQWNELMQYVTSEGAKGLCPDGWHIPSDAEWTTLTTFLEGTSVAGGKMKEAGTSHWASPNTGATNTSGFTALPGGYRYNDGTFNSLTYYANFWSSSQSDAAYAWNRDLYYSYEGVYLFSSSKTYGFSGRCLQD